MQINYLVVIAVEKWIVRSNRVSGFILFLLKMGTFSAKKLVGDFRRCYNYYFSLLRFFSKKKRVNTQ